jgi:hypothetical protein
MCGGISGSWMLYAKCMLNQKRGENILRSHNKAYASANNSEITLSNGMQWKECNLITYRIQDQKKAENIFTSQ